MYHTICSDFDRVANRFGFLQYRTFDAIAVELQDAKTLQKYDCERFGVAQCEAPSIATARLPELFLLLIAKVLTSQKGVNM